MNENEKNELDRLAADSESILTKTRDAENPNTSEELLNKLADDEHSNVRRSVARNESTSEAVLDRLANDESWPVRSDVASNSSASEETLSKLANDEEWVVRRGVASNSSASEAVLDTLSKDANEDVRKAVAKNENTTAETLDKLAEDKRGGVRQGVAEHPNTSEETLEKLSNIEFVDRNEAIEMLNEQVRDKVEDAYPNLDLKYHPDDMQEYVFDDLLKQADKTDMGYIKDDVEGIDLGESEHLLSVYLDEEQFNLDYSDDDWNRTVESAIEYNNAKSENPDANVVEGEGYTFVHQASNVEVIEDGQFSDYADSADKYDLIDIADTTSKDEILEILSKHEDEDVRYAVASNSNISEETLDTLSKDANEAVRDAVANNENASEQALENIDKAAMLENDFKSFTTNDEVDVLKDGQFNDDKDHQTESGSMKM